MTAHRDIRRPSRRVALLGALLLLSFTACEEADIPGPNLERMIEQERYQPYEASEFFEDGRAMRSPPTNTVPRGITLDPAIADGIENGAYVTRIPVPVTGALLVRGQRHFEITCAVCHGVAGDGDSWVARKMDRRKPPTLIGPRVRAFPDGRIYHIIQVGYGLMRSYAEDLDVEDRWAVVAYMRALQLATDVSLDALPPSLRQKAEEELR